MLDFIRKLFRRPDARIPEVNNSGEWITERAGGKNLVDGLPTFAHAETSKNDLVLMQRCCQAELDAMRGAGLVAAPFYFERAAILLRKAEDYEGEISVCESYIEAVEAFYATQDPASVADVRRGPRYAAIQHPLARARKLAGRA